MELEVMEFFKFALLELESLEALESVLLELESNASRTPASARHPGSAQSWKIQPDPARSVHLRECALTPDTRRSPTTPHSRACSALIHHTSRLGSLDVEASCT
jgi:hypothetical protein